MERSALGLACEKRCYRDGSVSQRLEALLLDALVTGESISGGVDSPEPASPNDLERTHRIDIATRFGAVQLHRSSHSWGCRHLRNAPRVPLPRAAVVRAPGAPAAPRAPIGDIPRGSRSVAVRLTAVCALRLRRRGDKFRMWRLTARSRSAVRMICAGCWRSGGVCVAGARSVGPIKHWWTPLGR